MREAAHQLRRECRSDALELAKRGRLVVTGLAAFERVAAHQMLEGAVVKADIGMSLAQGEMQIHALVIVEPAHIGSEGLHRCEFRIPRAETPHRSEVAVELGSGRRQLDGPLELPPRLIEPASDFTATVNWGIAGHMADPGSITQNPDGSYKVMANRPVFTEEGNYNVQVTIGVHVAGEEPEVLVVNLTATLVGAVVK